MIALTCLSAFVLRHRSTSVSRPMIRNEDSHDRVTVVLLFTAEPDSDVACATNGADEWACHGSRHWQRDHVGNELGAGAPVIFAPFALVLHMRVRLLCNVGGSERPPPPKGRGPKKNLKYTCLSEP